METQKASVTFLLDKRRTKKDATYPVKLTVYFDGEKKRYATGIDVTEATWQKLHAPNLRDDKIKTLKRKLNLKKDDAEQIIQNLSTFSFAAFESLFYKERQVRRSSDLAALFDQYIDLLEKKGRVGTADSYKTTKNSFLQFKGKQRITDINKAYLEEYEQHMLARDISPSTIGIYLRQLRRIINVAINEGILSADKYPYKGFTIPTSRNIKKALTPEQLKLLLHYQPKSSVEEEALDFWLFSYLCNGINMTDVCQLKPENVQSDFFYFFRAKTKHTKKRDLRPIKVPLTERSKKIIEKYKNADQNSPYLFPVLREGLTPRQSRYKIQDFIKKVNDGMRIVAKNLGISVSVNTYVARHSHSTMLKRKGASTEFIKENLGHSSVITTENYLHDFTDDVKKEFAEMLTDL